MKTSLLESFPEFNNHHLVISLSERKSGLRGFVAIHRGSLGYPAFGATRIYPYSSPEDSLRDALRLSRAMSYKSAMAGLPYGGAKATLIGGFSSSQRSVVLQSYAERVNALHGAFITGTDVGLNMDDLRLLRKKSPYMVGLKVNPEKYTALGMFFATRALCKEAFGNEGLTERSFAIQGLGKVGKAFLKLIYSEAKQVFVSDINKKVLQNVKREFPRVQMISPTQIGKQKVDIFSPCAMSRVLNQALVPHLRCSLIIGGANNQLENDSIGDALAKKGIFYSPDYVVNGGGLISVVDEFEHPAPSSQRIEKKVAHIEKTMVRIFKESTRRKESSHRISDAMAEELFKKQV